MLLSDRKQYFSGPDTSSVISFNQFQPDITASKLLLPCWNDPKHIVSKDLQLILKVIYSTLVENVITVIKALPAGDISACRNFNTLNVTRLVQAS